MSLAAAAKDLGKLVKGKLVGIKVTKTGASPRIMTANVIGTGGTVSVTGSQLEGAFGLLSTWAAFTTISSSASPTPAAAPRVVSNNLAILSQMESAFGQMDKASQTLSGAVFPAGKGTHATLEVRVRGRWHRSGAVHLGRRGSYSVRLASAGVYRVVYRGLAGRRSSCASGGCCIRLGRRMPGPLIAVDAPYVLYRSFYALPDTILGLDGKPVNALLGAVNLLLRAAADFGPRAIVMCFGAEAAPYRVELFPAYHADRPEVPEALAWQFSRAPSLFSAFGWDVSSSPEVEADDLLGSLAAVEADAGGRALIVTGDRDMYQCVSDCVSRSCS